MLNTREVIDRLHANKQLRHCGNFRCGEIAVGILVNLGSCHDAAKFLIGEVRRVNGNDSASVFFPVFAVLTIHRPAFAFGNVHLRLGDDVFLISEGDFWIEDVELSACHRR